MSGKKEKTEPGKDENLTSLLCYLFGWISGLIFILVEKENKTIRFHAWQSLILFGVYSLLYLIPFLGWFLAAILSPVVIILWIVLMVNAYKGKKFKLPVIGEYAAKQAK